MNDPSASPKPLPAPRKSLQARLALAYAAAIYLAGIVVLLIVDVPLASVQSAHPVGARSPAKVASGRGISLGQLLTGSLVALAILVPVSLALGWFVAGRFLRPLRAITSTARHIWAGDLHRRLNLGEPADELTELGRTLDDLFTRLESAFDAQRHFVANASHELRTPLAGQRTLLEVALADPDADAATLREVCREALTVGAHQERLVHALLVLATSERGVSRWEPCDVAQAARDAVAARRDQAAERGIGLTAHLAPATTGGDPKLIDSLITNLLDNALRHNHPTGHAIISTGTSGPWTTVTVSNSGPAVPEERVQGLLQPFQRLTSDRNEGHGLGLAIVNAVARAHHATLVVEARPEGGMTVTVRFAMVEAR